jgi:hypothetical protein
MIDEEKPYEVTYSKYNKRPTTKVEWEEAALSHKNTQAHPRNEGSSNCE